jgi:hypothetical protein
MVTQNIDDLGKVRTRGYEHCGIFTALSHVRARGYYPELAAVGKGIIRVTFHEQSFTSFHCRPKRLMMLPTFPR